MGPLEVVENKSRTGAITPISGAISYNLTLLITGIFSRLVWGSNMEA